MASFQEDTMTRILFQGDSITDMMRSREDENQSGVGYPTLVKARLGHDHPGEYAFFNRGIGGNRITDVYARIKSDIINLHPDCMSLLIGVNDMWQNWALKCGVDLDKFELIYDLLLEEVREALPDIKLMLMEPFLLRGFMTENTEEIPHRFETLRGLLTDYSAAVSRLARKHEAVFIPLQERFDRASKSAKDTYWLYDGVHPTAMGAELIARAWLEGFAQLK